jgi:hypothetical protein
MSLRGVTQLGDVLPHAALFISESIIARERRSGVLRPKTRLSNYQLGKHWPVLELAGCVETVLTSPCFCKLPQDWMEDVPRYCEFQ